MAETERGHSQGPTRSEYLGIQNSFTQSLLTKVYVYHTRPRGSWDKEKCLLEKDPAGPGLKIRVEGANSWQQYSKRYPKAGPGDIWVEGEIVFDPNEHHLEGRKVFVTRGDMKRLPPENRKASQRPLTKRAAKGPSRVSQEMQPENTTIANPPQVETRRGTEETFELRLPAGTKLFTEHPRPRLEGETKDQRKKYLDETANWITKGRTAITISGNRKETWANEDHWMGGKITTATREDLYPRNEDVRPLNLGQKVFISKGEASPKRPGKKPAAEMSEQNR